MSGLPFLSFGQQTPCLGHGFGALPRQGVVAFRLGDMELQSQPLPRMVKLNTLPYFSKKVVSQP